METCFFMFSLSPFSPEKFLLGVSYFFLLIHAAHVSIKDGLATGKELWGEGKILNSSIVQRSNRDSAH
jgi:hypothetical protein